MPVVCLLPDVECSHIIAVLSAAGQATCAVLHVKFLHWAPAASGASPFTSAPQSGRRTCGWVGTAAAGRCADWVVGMAAHGAGDAVALRGFACC
jgi:hypothetical protein